MRALTIRQPWVWAIMQGLKRIENRTWTTQHRGPLLVHAGGARGSMSYLNGTTPADWRHCGMPGLPPFDQLVFGALVGVVDVIDCVPLEAVAGQPFATGPWCWILDHPRPLATPIPYRGRQGLFDVAEAFLKNPAQALLAHWS